MLCNRYWAVGFSLMLGSSASGAQTTAVHTLPELRVSAEALSELPGSQVFNRTDLERANVQDWSDVQRELDPALHYNAQNKSITIRGMDRNRLNVRVDGIRLPWLDDGARGEQGGYESIDFDNLRSIDLVKGSGANRSGSLVGYLDVQTLRPQDILPADGDLGALLRSSWDGADDSLGAYAAMAGRFTTNTEWLLQAGQRRGHELKNQAKQGGDGGLRDKRNPETFTQRNYTVKLQHAFNQEHRLGLSGHYFERQADVLSRRDQGPGTSFSANHTDKQSKRERVVADYTYQGLMSQQALQQASIKLYWQKAEQEGVQHGTRKRDPRGDIIPGDPYGYAYPYGFFSRGNMVRESAYGLSSDAWGTTGSGIWRLGIDAQLRRARQYSSGSDNCPPSSAGGRPPFGPLACDFLHTNQADMPLVKGRELGVWIEHEFQLAQGQYSITPALRYDAWDFKAHGSGEYQRNPNAGIPSTRTQAKDQQISPSLLAQWHWQESLSLYARYGWGYTAPTAAQLFLNYGAPGTYLRAGNPELKAEHSRGWELGAEWGDERRGVRFSAFQNQYKNFIESDVVMTPDSAEWNPAWTNQYPMGVTAVANKARVRIYGAELAAHWMLNEQWRLRTAAAWAHGKDTNTGLAINSVAPLSALAALAYMQPQWGAELAVQASSKRKRVEDPTKDFQTPGFGVWDVKAWLTPERVQGLRIQAGIYNVFDKYYWQALSVPRAGGRDSWPAAAYTSPGRHVRLTLAYQF